MKGEATVALIKLKQKGQMTLPAEIRSALALKEGDLLEANIENGRVFLRPKTVVDRDRQAAVERFFTRTEENAAHVEAQLKAEGKTWDDLDAEIVEEVRVVRKERAERNKVK